MTVVAILPFLSHAFHFRGCLEGYIYEMAPKKASDLDGFPTLFCQKYWDMVGPSITEANLRCLKDHKSPKSVNDTLICVIPKKTSMERVIDYRPIIMCNVVYKIIAKAISNRLRVVLGKVISDT
ncbi:hypothetical protein Ddye_030253 [Dipteronia dyeriana]|uniref:Reverse transcriptase n=1 Tax=Dipteronia dyeriana TaxID=168575 RepID=A0AAD9WLF0_9ROSI|nr:hypothetical protein Ddye_030253 [Dipteronia dyeriana]